MTNLTDRLEYGLFSLEQGDLCGDPIEQLGSWWHDARSAKIPDLDAVNLATVDAQGHPDARIVLLKSFDTRGLVFFTNYRSTKARQLMNNPHASMTLFWPTLERQVRMRGSVGQTSREESQAYFRRRPRGAQLGAWASQQSTTVASRDQLEQCYAEASANFLGQEIPCPDHWGGFRLVPNYFEFWQGRHNRLHDRFCYRLGSGSEWSIERLAP